MCAAATRTLSSLSLRAIWAVKAGSSSLPSAWSKLSVPCGASSVRNTRTRTKDSNDLHCLARIVAPRERR